MIGITLLVTVLIFFTHGVAGACSRQQLISIRDAFFQGGEAKAASPSGVKLAANIKVVFNNVVQTSLMASPYSKMGGWTGFNVEAVDTDACQIATFRVAPVQLLSTRLMIDDSGALSEVEFLKAVSGDQFFSPSGFPKTTPAMWTTKQNPGFVPNIPAAWVPATGTPTNAIAANCATTAGSPRVLNRKELIYVASTYCDSLQGTSWSRCALANPTCPRNENGVTTTRSCGVGGAMFSWPVLSRRWVADSETGVVLGAFYFDYYYKFKGPSSLWLHEYFKVDGGKLSSIYAPMVNLPSPGGKFNDKFSPEATIRWTNITDVV